ncbi:HAD-IA family hydrolase [Lysobacter xanthus]
MTPAPTLVLFDLDGVLVEYDRGARVRHLAEALRVEPAAVHAALFESGLEDRFDAGTIGARDYLAALGDALGVAVDVATWAAARGAAMRLDPATVGLLRAVARRCDVAILTNNGGLLLDVLPRLLPSLADVFGERMLCSGGFGVRKPEPRVYLDAVRHLGHAPASTLFLDDAPANVDGARRAGLRSAHVPQSAALGDVLRAYGLG